MINQLDKTTVFTGAYRNQNWFYNKYYYSGANGRYHTFSAALNLLKQKHPNPVIIETGCQRQADDIGGGMSTSIFAEYIKRHDGSLYTVDISSRNLQTAAECILKTVGNNININFVQSDSVAYLKDTNIVPDLLYLDSFDYPIGDMFIKYGGRYDHQLGERNLWEVSPQDLYEEFKSLITPCQEHCVKEFEAIQDRLKEDTILLIDDNLLPGGGKPHLLKEKLAESEWVCLLDFQQSLWIRKL